VAAFYISNSIGVASTAVGGSGIAEMATQGTQIGLDVGMELGGNALNQLVDQIDNLEKDHSADDVSSIQSGNRGTHNKYAKQGKAQQGSMEKIAVHLCEALKSGAVSKEGLTQLQARPQKPTCPELMELVIRHPKMTHHLEKTERYNLAAYTAFRTALGKKTLEFQDFQAALWENLESITKESVAKNTNRDHAACEGGLCSPHLR
jgi:hypothetical protein